MRPTASICPNLPYLQSTMTAILDHPPRAPIPEPATLCLKKGPDPEDNDEDLLAENVVLAERIDQHGLHPASRAPRTSMA
jgi:hypothetical protein